MPKEVSKDELEVLRRTLASEIGSGLFVAGPIGQGRTAEQEIAESPMLKNCDVLAFAQLKYEKPLSLRNARYLTIVGTFWALAKPKAFTIPGYEA